jgi:leucyl-tRNA synthetase
VLMTFPLAPHIAAELWERLGHGERADDVPFPVADPEVLAAETVVVPVTVDGKPRGTITIGRDASEAEATAAGLAQPNVARFTVGRELARVVYVPAKILSLVTRDR